MSLADRTVLVVGGSESIGRAIAEECAAQGAKTVVCSRRPPSDFPRIDNARIFWEEGDMMDVANIKGVVKNIIQQHGRLDALIVSGAPHGAKAGLFAALPTEQYRLTLDSQFVSRLNCLHAVIDTMKAQRFGKVVFVTTDAGRTPTPGESIIGSAAAALIYFTRAVGRELARDGIRVNCVATTLTADTPAYERSRRVGENDVLAKAFAKLEARTPFRLNLPGDIAKLASFLVSSDSDQISGAVVSVNGGVSFP